ncbi:DNA-binding WRKY [Macleaya cordata]|uniref:DNA-binding WRKY n=1 Tax=Macleaya cordata TaxID=56857 RepID=A0A200R8T7_MACCD|nr:DNA-binding WRKY [Macleaya cordata]
MAEEEENRNEGIDDLRALITSPRSSLFPGFLSESSFSQLLNGTHVDPTAAANSNKNTELFSIGSVSDVHMRDSCYSNPPSGGRNGGSIAERRAARCGFNAPSINTARFRTISPLASPSSRSPYITIPAGLSPTTLLDSPVMLPNSQAQPSPTTGTYRFPSQSHEITVPISATCKVEKDEGEDVDSSFMFKPHVNPIHLQGFSDTQNQSQDVGMANVNHQVFAPLQPQMDYDSQNGFLKQTMTKNYAASSLSDIDVPNNTIVNMKCLALQTSQASVATDQATRLDEHVLGEDSKQLLEGDQKGAYHVSGLGRPTEDGYNWRKYGQKQVKGSEYPRSYYKCTHPNCQVKKKVERSRDGHITKIIYKADHNHQQPQPNRRSALGSAFSPNEISETGEDPGSYIKVEGGSVWRNLPHGSKDNKVGSDWRVDGLERTSSTSVVTELSDHLSTAQAKHLGILESVDTPELSSTLASHDEDEDRATQGSISLGDDAEDGESESKRRKKESCLIETNLASRAVREPRVVVQTDSEVDILDDGYRWRKYGQKVVKGNPNPRSYYKCTNAGCSVRKHVERASHDLKYVITTYEGKHNHEVPAARNSSHVNSNNANGSSGNPSAQSTMTLPRNATIPKPEPQLQDLVPRFERKPQLSNEFFKPSNLGGFATDMKFGPSACYEMKLPPFQTAMPCGSFGLNPNVSEVHHTTSIPQVVPEFPISLPINFPLSTNLEFTSFDFNNHGKPVVPVQPFLGVQQPKEEDMRFLRPKQEQKDDTSFESMNHLANASPSVMCRRFMGGFPL